MASSSSAIDNYDCYDVFLSFRSEDTRYNFTSHLNDALCRNNIKAFIDDKIDRGDEITPAVERVIEGAKISIIVFSKKYAESSFCLNELERIMECKESKAQIVLPIFYKVDPSEETYREAFARYETNIKVEGWKSAFRESLGLAGWHIIENSVEAEIIGKITKAVSEKLNNNLPKGQELMCKTMVGQKAEDDFKKIWECLMDDKISRVGVYGMGGVGKTTIATRINDQLVVTVNSFSRVCWVTVSKDLSIYNMQNKIAKMMVLDLSNEDDERKRAAKLRERLKTEKFVLILDDMWEAFEIEDVGIPPLVDGKKLLMTSRSRRVCEIMECEPIEVKPFFKKDALDLFMKESKCQINDSMQWGDIVGSIVEECGGLPLAIVVVARSMRGVKEIWKWRDTLRELQKPCEGENLEIEEKVFKVLKFSYDCLPNDRCRQCFLYCSLFPEDYHFYRDDLIEYWIGNGIIDEVDSRQAELDKGNVILDELMHASLLERIEYEKLELVKMHDVIRDMARMNVIVGLQFEESFESVQVLKMWKSFPNSTPHRSKLKTLELQRFMLPGFSLNMDGVVRDIDRINVKVGLQFEESFESAQVPKMLESFPNSTTHCSKLKTLILQGYDNVKELPHHFFANMQSLNVLHITTASVKSISDSISNLKNLRLLLINDCFNLGYIPSLAGLEKLRHLKISSNKKLQEIPKGIERLVNLRVLNFSRNFSLKEIPKGIKRLVNLRVLDLSMNYIRSGSFPSGVLENFAHLQTLNLINNGVEVKAEELISLEKLQVVKVYFHKLHNFICYVKSGHWRRLLDYDINYRGKIIIYRENGMCLNLMSLKGWKGEFGMILPDDIQTLYLENWESPMFYYLKNPTFANLQTVSICMYESRYLFPIDLAKHLLHNVQQLNITFCDPLVEIIGREEEWVNPINYINYPTILLPNLKTLALCYLPELRSIYSGRMVCPSLEVILINDSDKIERLPFCMEKEGNKQNPTIKLGGMYKKNPITRRWLDSLQWDDPNAKSMYEGES